MQKPPVPKKFSGIGDSVGLELDSRNNIVGIIFLGTGGKPNIFEGHEQLCWVWLSYMAVMGLILRRIEEVTRMKLQRILEDLTRREVSREEIEWPAV